MKANVLKRILNKNELYTKVHNVFIKDKHSQGTRFTSFIITYDAPLAVVELMFMDGELYEINGRINKPTLQDFEERITEYMKSE